MAIRNIIEKAEKEYPPISGGSSVDLSNYAKTEDIFNAAVEWTANHTLVDGTRYLVGDLVYSSGKVYRAKFDNESIPVSSELYWEDLGPGYRLNIDGRDIQNIPLADLSNVVFTSGNQDINGLKDFQTTPTVNDIPVLLSGDPVDLIHLYGKNDEATTIYKGQPVYIAGANGANPLIQLASNTGERTSSKTIGLLAQDLLANEFGYVITEGMLEGFDTSSGVAGDPIWLGPTGSLLFGTGNKPHAPNHLVYLGVVLRSNQNNGKVYIRTQNGYEVDEFHNVVAVNPQDRDTLLYNSVSGLWISRQLANSDLPSTIVYTTGNQTISGIKSFIDNTIFSGSNTDFYGDEYIFDNSNLIVSGEGSFEIKDSVTTKGVTKDLGGVSGIRAMTTGEYNAITPISGVIYILT